MSMTPFRTVRNAQLRCAVTAVLLVLSGCAPPGASPGAGPGQPAGKATLSAHIELGDVEGVHGVLYEVSCGGAPAETHYVEVRTGSLETVLGSTEERTYADLLLTVPVGECVISLHAMASPTSVASHCEPAVAVADVAAGGTTEIVVVLGCNGDLSGGVDVVAVIEGGPVFTALTFSPSKVVFACQEMTVTVAANASGSDPVALSWQIDVPTPPGLGPADEVWVEGEGNVATIYSNVAGSYSVTVRAAAASGSSALIRFPVHFLPSADCP